MVNRKRSAMERNQSFSIKKKEEKNKKTCCLSG